MTLSGGWGHEARVLRAAPAARGGEPWSGDEDARLLEEYRSGMRPEDMAGVHGRTPAACVARLVRNRVLVAHLGAYWELPPEPFVTVREMMNMAEATR